MTRLFRRTYIACAMAVGMLGACDSKAPASPTPALAPPHAPMAPDASLPGASRATVVTEHGPATQGP